MVLSTQHQDGPQNVLEMLAYPKDCFQNKGEGGGRPGPTLPWSATPGDAPHPPPRCIGATMHGWRVGDQTGTPEGGSCRLSINESATSPLEPRPQGSEGDLTRKITGPSTAIEGTGDRDARGDRRPRMVGARGRTKVRNYSLNLQK